MVNPRIRQLSPEYFAQSPRAPSPQMQFALDECCALHEPFSSSANSTCSRRNMATKPPTLTDILLDKSPPPWTLSAFTAYLSQNHCMETLEFTLDSQRYADFHRQLVAEHPPSPQSNDRVCGWWEKLMQVYIVPCAPREVNIPSRVRDHLLSLPYLSSPPHPSQLEEAGRIVYELMNDSLLVPFLQSVAPLHLVHSPEEHPRPPPRKSRSSDSRTTARSSASPHPVDSEGLTDDSDSNSPEPVTPPTTPPTSDYTFNTSPGSFQRAVAAHNKGWKKVGAKLGFSRKASSRRSAPTSSVTEFDVSLTEASQDHLL